MEQLVSEMFCSWSWVKSWMINLKSDQMLSPEIKWSKPGILTMVVSGSQLLGYISWSDIPPAFCFIYLIKKKNSTHKNNNNNSDTVWFLPRRMWQVERGWLPVVIGERLTVKQCWNSLLWCHLLGFVSCFLTAHDWVDKLTKDRVWQIASKVAPVTLPPGAHVLCVIPAPENGWT